MGDASKSDRELLAETTTNVRWIRDGIVDLKERNAAHDALDNKRFEDQGKSIEKLDNKFTWAMGVGAGVLLVAKFLFHA